MSYAELLPYGAPGFTAFALCSLPMGILADRWGRDHMMVVFFIGIGISSILTGFAQTPMQLGAGLLLIGIFGSIYHPVGLAIVTGRWKHTGMRLAVNGVWGNLGVGCAALVTGFMIDLAGWRTAFFIPGNLHLFCFSIPCKFRETWKSSHRLAVLPQLNQRITATLACFDMCLYDSCAGQYCVPINYSCVT